MEILFKYAFGDYIEDHPEYSLRIERVILYLARHTIGGVTHLYSFTDIYDRVCLYFCIGGNTGDLHTSAAVNNLELVSKESMGHYYINEVPNYLKLEYAKLLKEKGVPDDLIISIDLPVTKSIVAKSLIEAREKIEAHIPIGYQLISEEIVSDGTPKTVQATGDTIDVALALARGKLPQNADVIEIKENDAEVTSFKLIVDAFDEQSAKSKAELEAKRRTSNRVTVQGIQVAVAGNRGWFGFGRKASQYDIELLV